MTSATVEQEIIEQVRKLDPEQQKRVLDFIRTLNQSTMTPEEWLKRAQALQAEIRSQYGAEFVFGTRSILEEIREERLDDLLGSR